MSRRRDPHTLDLLDWQPPAIVKSYPEEKVRAVNWAAKLAKAVAMTLKECGQSRALVASRMGEFLGEAVSENMLDNYASEAREDTVISVPRLIALALSQTAITAKEDFTTIVRLARAAGLSWQDMAEAVNQAAEHNPRG